MARVRPSHTTFAGGEISPLLHARSDWGPYANSCLEMRNVAALPEGAAERRPGTEYIAAARDTAASAPPYLFPFEFSVAQTYVIEVAAGALRFFLPGADGGLVVADGTDGAVTNGGFDTNLSGWTLTQAGSATVAQAAGACELRATGSDEAAIEQDIALTTGANRAVATFTIGGPACGAVTVTFGDTTRRCAPGTHALSAPANATPLTLKISNTEGYTLTVDDVALVGSGQQGSQVPFELAAPIQPLDLLEGAHVQSADVIYMTPRDKPTLALKRYGGLDWSLERFDYRDGPYLSELAQPNEDHTMSPSSGTGVVVVTSSEAWVFWDEDVGRPIAIKNGSDWAWGTILERKQRTQAWVLVRKGTFPTTATNEWRIGAYAEPNLDSRTNDEMFALGWPSCVALFQQRLVIAGANRRPHRYDTSIIGAFQTFTPGADADLAVSGLLTQGGINAAHWLLPAQRLIAGTAGAEIAIGPASDTQTITPDNAPQRVQTLYGSERRHPLQIGNDTSLYVARGGQMLLEMAYDALKEGFGATDVSVRAKHIAQRRFRQLAYQQTPHRLMWAVLEDGGLAAVTYMREQEVIAWHRHELGATAAGAAKVLSAACVPTPNSAAADGQTETWFAVERVVNGSTARYIERLTHWRSDQTPLADQVFVDSALSYDGAATTTLSGLDHLEGEQVQILADGAVQPAQTVQGGQVALSPAAAKVHVGLAAPATLIPTPPALGAQDGDTLGRQRRVNGAAARVHRTPSIELGTDVAKLERVLQRRPDQLAGPGPYSGMLELPVVPARWSDDTRLVVRQSAPLPMTVLALSYFWEVGYQ